MHSILIGLVIYMKLENLKNLSQRNLQYSSIDKHLSDMFAIKNVFKQDHVLSPLFFKFVLEYAIRSVQGKQDGWKLNGTHQVLVYADYINILGGKYLL